MGIFKNNHNYTYEFKLYLVLGLQLTQFLSHEFLKYVMVSHYIYIYSLYLYHYSFSSIRTTNITFSLANNYSLY